MADKTFGVIDYTIFGLVLLCSSLIGIYFAYRQRKNASSAEYLVASRSLGWFPVFVSMIATFFSAIGVMGFPSQIYSTGITFLFNITSFIFPFFLCVFVFGPMFRKLELVSVNEYLEKRFSTGVRTCASVIFFVQNLLYLSVALYTPSLALESVSGVPIYATLLSTGVVCTFYTSLGGMRAVIWTDVFQSAIMFTGLLITMIVGAKEAGSWSHVVDINSKMERLKINYSFDPRELHTIWGIWIGISFSSISTWNVRQTFAQRFVAAKSLKQAQIAMVATFFGITAVVVILAVDALIVFAVYSECDLLMSKKIRSNDQILPYFVVNKLSHITGMPGLFTACLFSFALSSLSSGLNAMSALMLEDFVKKIKPGITEKQGTNVSKITAIVGGVFMTVFAFAVPYLGKYVLRISILLSGVLGAPLFSMFALGMFTKKANKIGVLSGSFIGAFIGMFFSVGQLFYPPTPRLPPLSIRGCSFFNATRFNDTGIIYRQQFASGSGFTQIFSISYVWFSGFTMISSLLFGYLISLCTNRYVCQKDIDKDLMYDWRNSSLFRIFSRRTIYQKYKANKSTFSENKEENFPLSSAVAT